MQLPKVKYLPLHFLYYLLADFLYVTQQNQCSRCEQKLFIHSCNNLSMVFTAFGPWQPGEAPADIHLLHLLRPALGTMDGISQYTYKYLVANNLVNRLGGINGC